MGTCGGIRRSPEPRTTCSGFRSAWGSRWRSRKGPRLGACVIAVCRNYGEKRRSCISSPRAASGGRRSCLTQSLTLGKRTPQQTIYDPGYFNFGNHRFRDDKEGGHGTVDMYKSIVQSCDTYYYMLANDLGVDAIHDFMAPIGFGQATGIDLQGELRGTLPSTEWKRAAYKKKEAQKWYAGETISPGIGQGYNAFTMLQLAQAEATMAQGGQRHAPHLVRAVEHYESRKPAPLVFADPPPLPWKPEYVALK